MSYAVHLSRDAEADLERLFDYLLIREMAREGGDLTLPGEAVAAIRASIALLERFPFTCRKSEENAFLRELIIPFGRTGYVALFDVSSNDKVTVLAIRHQREDDYH